eukprot:jgi/Botrbrau1/12140/Bobra.0186s0055.1
MSSDTVVKVLSTVSLLYCSCWLGSCSTVSQLISPPFFCFLGQGASQAFNLCFDICNPFNSSTGSLVCGVRKDTS